MIDQARQGDAVALGLLLESHRDRLRTTARGLISPTLRTRIDASDIVQEAFLLAHREFPSFQGREDLEFGAWLRAILIHCLADQVKHHHRRSRDRARQESLDAILQRAGASSNGAILARDPSPSEAAVRGERAALLAAAVDRLPADQRAVYLLRAVEHLPFERIAPRLGRSVGAARMLWTRALERLSLALRENS